MSTPRTLIIGLDGATFDLIDPMIRAGDLPVMARLIDRGVRSPLQTWPNTNSAAAWSSMVTGYNSGQHGVFHFSEAIHKSDVGSDWNPTTGASRHKDPFWRVLSDAGKRVGVINVPISYPADPVSGFMLAGMDAPGVDSSGFAHPPSLVAELRALGIDYVVDVPDLGVARRQNPHALPRQVRRMIEARSRTILHLMKSKPWDALMAVFVATDRVQHYFWPEDLSDLEKPDWTPIRDVYRLIDRFFERALELVDQDTTIIVVSDHGFGPSIALKRCLNPLFSAVGLLKTRDDRRLRASVLGRLLKLGRRYLPYSVQQRLASRLPSLHLRIVNEGRMSKIVSSETRVLASAKGSRIWVNLEGRQPEGIVKPDEYEALRSEVVSLLTGVTAPGTGKPVVRSVRKREEIYHGPYAANGPDMVIEWDYDSARGNEIQCTSGNRSLTLKAPEDKGSNVWSGSHRPEGIFVACGPEIKQGATLTGSSIYDIAPTVLYLHDLPVPEDIDGVVLTEAFTDGRVSSRPVRYCSPRDSRPAQDAPLNEEDARTLRDRLKGLGYIE